MDDKKLPAWVRRLTGDLAGATKHGRQGRGRKRAKAARKKRRKMVKASRKKSRR